MIDKREAKNTKEKKGNSNSLVEITDNAMAKKGTTNRQTTVHKQNTENSSMRNHRNHRIIERDQRISSIEI